MTYDSKLMEKIEAAFKDEPDLFKYDEEGNIIDLDFEFFSKAASEILDELQEEQRSFVDIDEPRHRPYSIF